MTCLLAATVTARSWKSSKPLRPPLTARLGYASPELQRTFERTVALAESLGRKDSTVVGLVALWSSRFVQGRTADAYQIANRALSMVDPSSRLRGQVHLVVGGSALSLGRPAEGLRHLELAADLTDSPAWLITGVRSDLFGMVWGAQAHWLLGHDTEAPSACHQAIKLARSIDNPFCLAVALAYSCITYQMRHDLPALKDAVGELRELCDRHGFAYYREWGLILDGWSRMGEPGIGLAQQGIGNLKAEGSYARMPYWLSLLADLLASNDRPDAAQDNPRGRPGRRQGARRSLVATRGDAHACRLRREAGRHLTTALRRPAGVGSGQCGAAPALRA